MIGLRGVEPGSSRLVAARRRRRRLGGRRGGLTRRGSGSCRRIDQLYSSAGLARIVDAGLIVRATFDDLRFGELVLRLLNEVAKRVRLLRRRLCGRDDGQGHPNRHGEDTGAHSDPPFWSASDSELLCVVRPGSGGRNSLMANVPPKSRGAKDYC